MLEWRNVGVRLSGREILRGISFSLRAGRITVLLGRNGSGKSTLLSCVCRVLPYSGEILCGGVDIAKMSARERAQRIAVLPQILPDSRLTVRGLVSLGRTPYIPGVGIMSEDDRAAVRDAMERADVSELADRVVCTLSGGERQRAFVAMMLAQRADCLLFDEPTTYMDIAARRELYDICLSLRDSGKTILLTMHEINEALRLADDIILLDGSGVAFSGSRDELLQTDLIEQTYRVTRHMTDDGICFFC